MKPAPGDFFFLLRRQEEVFSPLSVLLVIGLVVWTAGDNPVSGNDVGFLVDSEHFD